MGVYICLFHTSICCNSLARFFRFQNRSYLLCGSEPGFSEAVFMLCV